MNPTLLNFGIMTVLVRNTVMLPVQFLANIIALLCQHQVQESTGSSGHSQNIISTPKSSSKKLKDIEPKVRHKYAAIWNACSDNVNRALANREDFFLRSNAIEQVKESLSELWSFRIEHNQAFAETVNLIQGVLIDRKAEDFSDNQLDTLRSIFDKLSNEPSLDDSLANIISIDLLKGNIDVFSRN